MKILIPHAHKPYLPILWKEIIMEIGNILIEPVWVNKRAVEHFGGIFSTSGDLRKSVEFNRFLKSFDPANTVIAMKTVFRFQQKDIKGFILVY